MDECMHEWTETKQTKLGFPINVNKPQVSFLKKKKKKQKLETYCILQKSED